MPLAGSPWHCRQMVRLMTTWASTESTSYNVAVMPLEDSPMRHGHGNSPDLHSFHSDAMWLPLPHLTWRRQLHGKVSKKLESI